MNKLYKDSKYTNIYILACEKVGNPRHKISQVPLELFAIFPTMNLALSHEEMFIVCNIHGVIKKYQDWSYELKFVNL